MLSVRFGLAAAVLVAVMLARRAPWPRGRVLAGLVALGAVGYVGQSLAFFSALTLASASLVTVLLYLYPGLVVLLSRVAFGERLTARKAGALALAVVGTVLTVGPVGGGAALGVVLGVTVAVIYSVYIIGSAVVTPEAGALASATVVISSAAVVYAGLALATRPDYPTAWPGCSPVWASRSCRLSWPSGRSSRGCAGSAPPTRRRCRHWNRPSPSRWP